MLRAARPEEIPQIAALIARNPLTLQQQDEAELRALATDPQARVLVRPGADGAMAGFATLETLYPQVLFLTNLALVQPGQGQGLALIRAALAVAFDEMQAHRLFCDIAFDNAGALAAFARAGLVREGTMRECWLRPDGWVDCHAFSMLAREWRA
jgi:RimJ/RimL family protein N-acetyltransferase